VGDFERSLVKRPLFSQAGLNSLYTVEPTGSSVYLSAQVCAKGICWYNYITYFFVLLVSNKKGGLAIPLQLAEVGVSSPIEDEDKLKLKTVFEVDAYPLRLAYASTVHKVQGLSIPSLYIDCKRFFLPSQLYVALSRSSNPNDLTMVNFSPDKIIADPKVVQWYNEIQSKMN